MKWLHAYSKPLIPTDASPAFIQEVIDTDLLNQLPYDAIKHSESGQHNWAFRPGVKMKTPWGTPLTKGKKK